MSATGPAKRAPNENSNLYEEKEIKLYKHHKKYYEDVVDITSAVWRRNRNYESLQVIPDINLFMSRYSVTENLLVNVMDVRSTCIGKDTNVSIA